MSAPEGGAGGGPSAAFGLLCALPEELGSLRQRARDRRRVLGHEVFELELGRARLFCCVSGIGKVSAAHAAAALVQAGASRALLVVGVCGGLRAALVPGTLVHCTKAVQVDLSTRGGREVPSDRLLRDAWMAVSPAAQAWFLTADRPVLSRWRRARLAGAFAGPCVADMETAAAAAVAMLAGVPWAAFRAVTDPATGFGRGAFLKHFPIQAGRCAETVPRLIQHLEDSTDRGHDGSKSGRSGSGETG